MRRVLVLLLVGSLAVLLIVVSGSTARLDPVHRASRSSASTASARPTAQPPDPVALGNGWSYRADPNNVGLAQNWGSGGGPSTGWQPVALPNDFNPTVSPSGDRGTVGWYRLQFTGPAQPKDRSWSVAFESVRRNTTVWLNSYEIGHNSDPYAPFTLPASSLRPGATNTLLVRVDNIKGGGTLPEDWWNWGGIMGPVELEPQGRLQLLDLGVLPELTCNYRCGQLLVQGTAVNRSAIRLRPTLVVRVTDPSGHRTATRVSLGGVRSGGSDPINLKLPLHGRPDLWSPSSPALYSVTVELDAGGRTEQTQTLQVGMRSVQVRRGVLYLNGRRLWLHGAAIHEDLIGRGAALSDGDIDTIVSELRSVGANITRAHYLLSPRLLSALDAAGIMVWEQAPVDHADSALRRGSGRRHALSLLRSTLLGDRSHPSVIVNSVGNELTPNPDRTPGTLKYLQQAIGLARHTDPAAAVGLDTYCYPGYPKQHIYSSLDVLGISSYFGWYTGPKAHSIADFNRLRPFLRQSHARYPKQALAVSEFGAEALYDGPATVKGTYEFQADYLQRTLGVIDRLPFMNGSIYWTLREFAVSPGWTGGAVLPSGAEPDGLHHKGLIAYDGTPKPAFTLAQKLFGQTPTFVR